VQLDHERSNLIAQRLGSGKQSRTVWVDAEPAQGATGPAHHEVRALGVAVPFFVFYDGAVAAANLLVEGGRGISFGAFGIGIQ
jgi:hypothetical protein